MQQRQDTDRRQYFWSTILIGIGSMAAVDEIVFHQVLAWHHFYDRSTTDIGLLTDGLLHAAELVAIVAGFFLFADARSRGISAPRLAWGGFLLGAGGFQVFDGVVDHKILRLHQIRYDVDILPYDVAWIGFGLILLVAGALVLRTAGTPESGLES